jgi:hypothetical protein
MSTSPCVGVSSANAADGNALTKSPAPMAPGPASPKFLWRLPGRFYELPQSWRSRRINVTTWRHPMRDDEYSQLLQVGHYGALQ